MKQTVVGYFDTPDAAHAAEQALSRQGIEAGALHLAAENAAYAGRQRQADAQHGTSGIRQFFSELFGADDEADIGHYSEAVRRGGVVLAVDVPDETSVESVREALLESGAVDIEERVEQWRKQGYSGYQPDSAPYSAEEVARERSTVLPVIQENIEVGKREVDKGTVRVYSRIEEPFREDVTLREEHATIARRPVDRPASEADLEAMGEKSVEVREMAEKAVVNKTARIVEEVEVGKEVSERTETIEDRVRHTEVEVDRGDRSDASAMRATSGTRRARRAFDDYEAAYRSDFETRYASQGGRYEDYAPAYRYGYGLSEDARYEGRDWSAIEPEVQRDWNSRYPDSAWERFRMAVRRGWESVTGDR